jgi:hypothetical protein
VSENRHYRNNKHFINTIQIYLLNHVHEFRFGRILSQRSHDGSKFLGGNGAWVSSSKKRAPLWAESWECQCATRPRRVTWQKANESIATRSLHNSPLSFNKTLYNRRVCALKKQSAFPCCARVSGRIVFGAVRYVDSGTNSTWKHCWIRANKWQAILATFHPITPFSSTLTIAVLVKEGECLFEFRNLLFCQLICHGRQASAGKCGKANKHETKCTSTWWRCW